jgi:hypothetical protein
MYKQDEDERKECEKKERECKKDCEEDCEDDCDDHWPGSKYSVIVVIELQGRVSYPIISSLYFLLTVVFNYSCRRSC